MTDDLKERLKIVACCDTDSTMRHFAYAFMEQDPDGDYVTYAAAKAHITDLEARLATAEAAVNRLREGEARLSLLLNETARARDAAEAGEDALAECLRRLLKGDSYRAHSEAALTAYEARRKG